MLFDADSYRELLGAELSRRVQSNPRYSQRAFARQLGMSPGELSEILRGKRPLSLKAMLRIAKLLGLAGEEQGEAGPATQLSLDMFAIVSDWYSLAILSLAECHPFRWDESWIAERLGISPPEVRGAIARLERIGILERKTGRLSVVKDFVMSPDGVPSEAIRNYHRQILARAITALDEQSVDERFVSGITFALEPKRLTLFKKELSEFLQKMGRKHGSGKRPTEVYQLELALIRLTGGVNHVS